MKKKLSGRRKLQLSRVLVRKLDANDLTNVVGAAPTNGKFCGAESGTKDCAPTDSGC